MGIGFLYHRAKKGSKMMVMMMDYEQNLFPSTARFGASFCFHYVIQYDSSSPQGRRGRVFIKELHDSHVRYACNDCNSSTICIYHEEKLQPGMLIFWGYIFYTSWKKTLKDEWYVVIKAYKLTVTGCEILRLMCIAIYCEFVLSLHIELPTLI